MRDKIKILMICHGNSGAIYNREPRKLDFMGFFA